MEESKIINWFISNYNNPAESVPYDSKEGGYIPIFGPLKETRDILYANCPELSDDDVEAYASYIEDISEGNDIWSPIPGPDWYEDLLGDIVITDTENVSSETLEAFARLSNVLKYNTLYIDDDTSLESIAHEIVDDDIGIKGRIYQERSTEFEQDLLYLYFIKAFSIMESYLEDYIINYAKENILMILDNIDRFPKLRDQKLTIGELIVGINDDRDEYVANIQLGIEGRIWAYYQSINWHQFEVATTEYKRFGIDLNLPVYTTARSTRHDLIHRDGKHKGKMDDRHKINIVDIKKLIAEGISVVENIQTRARKNFTLEL